VSSYAHNVNRIVTCMSMLTLLISLSFFCLVFGWFCYYWAFYSD